MPFKVLPILSNNGLFLTLYAGHRDLYIKGVLHRDISPGNLIIECPQTVFAESSPDCLSACLSACRGRVIDLDRAKRGKPKGSTQRSSASGRKELADEDIHVFERPILLVVDAMMRAADLPAVPEGFEIQGDVIRSMDVGLGVPDQPYGVDAVVHALRFNDALGRVCSLETLSWRQVRARTAVVDLSTVLIACLHRLKFLTNISLPAVNSSRGLKP